MTPLSYHDVYWCRARLPRAVDALLRAHAPRLVLAGGFIRSVIARESVNDVDLFADTKEHAWEWAAELAATAKKSVHVTDNALTVKCMPRVQFITRWVFDDVEKLVESFDFTVARAALWYAAPDATQVMSLCDDRYYADLAARRLVYCSPEREEEAGGSLLRVLKFYQRGYRIPLDSLGAVIGRLMKGVDGLGFKGYRVHDNEGGAQHLGRIVTGLLREVDPAIDPTHAAHDPTLVEGVDDAEA